MKCEQFERLIALEVEDDLPGNQKIKLTAHLAACGSCHRFAEELRDSQTALRRYSIDDFDEGLLAGIRQNVLSEINNGNIGHSYWDHVARWLGISDFRRFAWAMSGIAGVLALAAAFGIVVVIRSDKTIRVTAQVPKLEVPGSGPVSSSSGGGGVKKRIRQVSHKQSNATCKPSTFDEAVAVNRMGDVDSKTNAEGATSDLGNSVAEAPIIPQKDVTRIEMRTSNPNIRIILLVDKNEGKKPNAPPAAALFSSE